MPHTANASVPAEEEDSSARRRLRSADDGDVEPAPDTVISTADAEQYSTATKPPSSDNGQPPPYSTFCPVVTGFEFAPPESYIENTDVYDADVNPTMNDIFPS